MQKVFIVEDDKQIRDELVILLSRNKYEVITSTDFRTVVEDVLVAVPDIVLLDLNLPYVDGHVICRELRDRSDVGIIVVTSRNSDLDELMSMNLGADDFITKPYSPQILLARIASVLRRSDKVASTLLFSYEGLELDPAKSQVTYGEQSAELTKNEMRILQVLMQHAENIVSREEMQNELWQSDQFIDDNTLTVNVNRLRSTLARIGVKDYLHTKRGLGYYIKSAQADESADGDLVGIKDRLSENLAPNPNCHSREGGNPL